MRQLLTHSGAEELHYEIRSIVAIGKILEEIGVKMAWENIGDPIAKGEKVPEWIREHVSRAIEGDVAFGYCPTKGVEETRCFIANYRKQEGVEIDPEDILFYNGLGDAISHVYAQLKRTVRVIGPDPAYPTHSSAEATHAGSAHLTYKLDPQNNWFPDIDDLTNKIRYNPQVVGILIINPDNPTGMVYSRSVLERIVDLAREFNLFLISDEIYARIVYGDEPFTPLYSVIGNDVPALVMRGLSKEVPWPGARCGWVEFYNTQQDESFRSYAKSLVDAKMLEVCSTTLPQMVLPDIFSDNRYQSYVNANNDRYARRADVAHKILSQINEILVVKPKGAFYLTVMFREGVLSVNQSLPIDSSRVRGFICKRVQGVRNDKRFVLYLMASKGVCVVPLSGLNGTLDGFRLTLLEHDDDVFEKNIHKIAAGIREYVQNTQKL